MLQAPLRTLQLRAVQGMKVLRVGTRGSMAALAANRSNPNAPRPWELESGFTNKTYRPLIIPTGTPLSFLSRLVPSAVPTADRHHICPRVCEACVGGRPAAPASAACIAAGLP